MKNSLLHCYYFSARIHPPRASTVLLDMNNPNPVPSYDFVELSLGDILVSISIPIVSSPTISFPQQDRLSVDADTEKSVGFAA